MEMIRRYLNNEAGRIVLIVVMVGAIGMSVWGLRNFFGNSGAGEDSRNRWLVCAETGKAFKARIDEKTQLPMASPYSGKATGYFAELCYWGKDGGVLKEPTAVLLGQTVGRTGPTFCPECGRLVVGQNPYPYPGEAPPPTEAEYHSARAQAMR